MTTFPNIYLIYSSWSISEIRDFLEFNAKEGETVGTHRVEMSRGKETNRSLAIFSESLYKRLLESGYGSPGPEDFVVKPFVFPPISFVNRSLYVRLPAMSGSVCRQYLETRLEELVYFELLPQASYKVRVMWESRQLDKHRGSSFITFSDSVPMEVINMVRKVLSGMNWEEKDGEPSTHSIQCFWARTENRSKRGSSSPPTRSSPFLPATSSLVPTTSPVASSPISTSFSTSPLSPIISVVTEVDYNDRSP